jgi:hypothetical protein
MNILKAPCGFNPRQIRTRLGKETDPDGTFAEVLDVLFDASWIWFGKDKQRPSCNWKRVKSNSDLQLWQDA